MGRLKKVLQGNNIWIPEPNDLIKNLIRLLERIAISEFSHCFDGCYSCLGVLVRHWAEKCFYDIDSSFFDSVCVDFTDSMKRFAASDRDISERVHYEGAIYVDYEVYERH